MNHPISTAITESVEGATASVSNRPLVFPYKLLLAAHDVVVAFCVAAAGLWVGSLGFFPGLDRFEMVLLLVLCLLPLTFFGTFQLYSYHLIYSRRYHLACLVKAFVLSLFTIGTVTLTYAWPNFNSPVLLISILAGICLSIVVLNRFFEDKISLLLKALGLAFMAVGLAGFMGFRDDPIVLRRLPEAVSGLLVVFAVLTTTRYALVHQVFNVKMRRRFRRQVLLVGTNHDAEHITNLIIKLKAPFWVAGTVCSRPSERLSSAVTKSNLGRIQDLEKILGEHFFQEAIITDETISKPELIELLDFFTTRGINVWFLPKLMPIIGMKLQVDQICGIPLIRLNSRRYQWVYSKVKYAVDALATLIGFILVLPIFAVMALSIKLTSEGPVFYKARAVGKGGRLFTMYKFRSMITGAKKDIHQDYVTRLIRGEITRTDSGEPLKIVDDPRVTKVGKILRKTSLDELPQLINVLKGEMSLVGPRPCLPYEYEVYKDWHKKRTSVRPGITGLWQVVGRSEVDFEDMILLDLYYIYNRSLDLDLSTLFETVFVVLKKKGAH